MKTKLEVVWRTEVEIDLDDDLGDAAVKALSYFSRNEPTILEVRDQAGLVHRINAPAEYERKVTP